MLQSTLIPEDIAMLALILARVLMGALFVIGGLQHFKKLDPITGAMAARGVPQARLDRRVGVSDRSGRNARSGRVRYAFSPWACRLYRGGDHHAGQFLGQGRARTQRAAQRIRLQPRHHRRASGAGRIGLRVPTESAERPYPCRIDAC